MTLKVACPHCQTPLLLPDGCGGQLTRCPSCLANFLIPEVPTATIPVATVLNGAPSQAAAPPGPEFNEADLKRAQQRFDTLTAENVGLQVELARRARQLRHREQQTAWLKRFQTGRTWLDHSAGRIGGFFITIAVAPALAIVLFSVLGLSVFGYFSIACLAMIAAGCAYVPFSYFPPDEQLAQLIPQAEDRLAETRSQYELLVAGEAVHRESLAEAEIDLARIRSAVSSRLAWLRACHWQGMNSKTLARFLEQVFDEHGFAVEPTGKKGQAGVDFVAERGGVRIAVQVKGIQATSVDESVVRQTHEHRQGYSCQKSAVITNAQFLPSARQTADKLGVRLVDAREIPELIEGRVQF
jgi:hypothetical protein